MPDSNLDLEALEPHHRGYCALFTNPLVGDCTCDWPATLAALERAGRVEAAARRAYEFLVQEGYECGATSELRAALAAAPAESRQPDGGDSLSADEVEQLQTAAAERRARPLLPPFQPAGTDLIVAERRRQVEAEGWTPEHDDGHERGELVDAAICYARLALGADPVILEGTRWPWGGGFKPGTDERNLARAGALIAAEIDRLQRSTAPAEDASGG